MKPNEIRALPTALTASERQDRAIESAKVQAQAEAAAEAAKAVYDAARAEVKQIAQRAKTLRSAANTGAELRATPCTWHAEGDSDVLRRDDTDEEVARRPALDEFRQVVAFEDARHDVQPEPPWPPQLRATAVTEASPKPVRKPKRSPKLPAR